MRNAAKRQPSEETRDHHGQFKERQKAREISKARKSRKSLRKSLRSHVDTEQSESVIVQLKEHCGLDRIGYNAFSSIRMFKYAIIGKALPPGLYPLATQRNVEYNVLSRCIHRQIHVTSKITCT